MGLFSFFKFRKSAKADRLQVDPHEYMPLFWEDDYCQIEIVPFENRTFIGRQAEQIEELSVKSRSEHGFTETFARASMPVPTISKEIRVDYLERTLTSFQFPKAKYIQYEQSKNTGL